MKNMLSLERQSQWKQKLMVGALLMGGSCVLPGCGCECVGLATAVTAASAAAPIIFVAREVQEAQKTALEIQKLKSKGAR